MSIYAVPSNHGKNHGYEMKNYFCGGSLDVEYNAIQNQPLLTGLCPSDVQV